MEFQIWKIRALLIILLCSVFSIGWFSTQPELLEQKTSALPPLATSDQNTNIQFQQLPIQKTQATEVIKPPVFNQAKLSNYTPKLESAWANPVNYGDRYITDIYGKSVNNQPILVLHETVSSATSAINHFQKPHPNENDQASYHTLIKLDGTIVYLVPPEKRAFGAGNSVFVGANGKETVKTHLNFPPSVNNFAYHASLETPPDGRNNNSSHSGYTEAQYQSLAWLIAQSSITSDRITTHQAVDRSGSRIDPRSFDFKKFLNLLNAYRFN